MNQNQKLHQAKLYEWAAKVSAQKSSGLTVPVWCEQNRISVHAYNYWKHQLKQEAINQLLPEVVPVSLPAVEQIQTAPLVSDDPPFCANRAICTTAKLTVGGIAIEVDETISDEFLARILKAVAHA